MCNVRHRDPTHPPTTSPESCPPPTEPNCRCAHQPERAHPSSAAPLHSLVYLPILRIFVRKNNRIATLKAKSVCIRTFSSGKDAQEACLAIPLTVGVWGGMGRCSGYTTNRSGEWAVNRVKDGSLLYTIFGCCI